MDAIPVVIVDCHQAANDPNAATLIEQVKPNNSIYGKYG